jgi:hypothetical protein
MVTIPATSYYWQQVNEGDSPVAGNWTLDADGTFTPTPGLRYLVKAFGQSADAAGAIIAETFVNLAAITEKSIIDGSTTTFTASATGTNILFSVDAGPAWVTVHPTTGMVSMSPPLGTGATFSATIRARNSQYSDSETFNVVVSAVPAFSFPPLTTAKYDGDSRSASMGGMGINSGILSVQGGYGAAFNSAGLIQSVLDNKFLLKQGFQHAVGASSSYAQLTRMNSLSIANTGNPAAGVSFGATDDDFSIWSDGLHSVLTQPGSHVFTPSIGVNDGSGASAAYYNNPSLVSQTLNTIATIADQLGVAGKVWYVGVGEPRGRQFVSMESRTVTGGTCTATLVNRFTDGESFGVPGVIGVFASGFPKRLTKVGAAPAQDQYTVSAGGVYVFGGTAPTTVFLNYNAQPSGGLIATNDAIRVVREFMLSSAANFVSAINSVNYGIPGLLYNRPHVRVWDSFTALVDPTTGAEQLALPGTMDNQQLHCNIYGAYKTAVALKAVFDADYPSAQSQALAPTRNNWWAARGTGAGVAFDGTLPTTMRTGFTGTPAPTIISINRAVIGSVNTGTGAITGTGIVSGSLNFATGAWSITFDLASRMPANAQLWFEQDIGDYNVATLTPGTQGRNLLMNGLMEVFTAVGTNLTVVSGTSTISTVPAASVPYGWGLSGAAVQTAITAGTMEMSVFSDTLAGYPRFSVRARGVHSAAATPTLGQTISNATAAVEGINFIQSGAQISYQDHPVDGTQFGHLGTAVSQFIVPSPSLTRPSPTGPASVTSMGSRTADGGSGMHVPENLLTDAGGQFSAYRLTPMVDVSDVVSWGTTQLNITIVPVALMPFSYNVGYGRIQFRAREDVA